MSHVFNTRGILNEYNPASDKWTAITNFPGTKVGYMAGFSINNEGYIGLGFGFSNNKYTLTQVSDLWKYSPGTSPLQPPQSILSVIPASQDFGTVALGNSKELEFMVTNSGADTLAGSVSTVAPFSIVSGGSFNLVAGASQIVMVRFNPTMVGSFSGKVSFASNGGNISPVLKGIGDLAPPPQPVFSITPSSLDFGTVTIGSPGDLKFTVTNTGTGTLTGTASASATFSIVSGDSFSLAADASQEVVVRFNPTEAGSFSGKVNFVSNGGSVSPVLIGTGTSNATKPKTPTGTMPGSTTSPGPTQSSNSVGLSWDAVPEATYYSLGVTDMTTDALAVDTYPTDTSYTASLTAGGQYRWNVAACNTTGCSDYTTPLYFQTPAAVTTSPPPYPVILIHGINSDSTTWKDFRDQLKKLNVRDGGSLTFFEDRVVNTSDKTLALSTGSPSLVNPIKSGDIYALDFSDSNNLTFQRQGWELGKIIAKVKEVNNAEKVVLVGHSMGGLAARAYLQGFASSQTGEQFAYHKDVEKLITVGTPHQGSPWPFFCQKVLYINEVCDFLFGDAKIGGGAAAANKLKPDSPELNQLNLNPKSFPPINYVSIVVTGMFLDLAGTHEDGDGVVTESSQNLGALALPANVSPLRKALPSIYIDPFSCTAPVIGKGKESHTCEPGNSSVQNAILSELQGTSLANITLPTTNIIGISSTASGLLTARTLAVTVQPIMDILSTPVQYFVAASVEQAWYFLTSAGWRIWTDGSFPVYDAGTFAAKTTQTVTAHTIRVLDGSLDLSGLVGTQVYVGYGASDSEMLANGRYSLVHTVQ